MSASATRFAAVSPALCLSRTTPMTSALWNHYAKTQLDSHRRLYRALGTVARHSSR